jgi:hypothetical protein
MALADGDESRATGKGILGEVAKGISSRATVATDMLVKSSPLTLGDVILLKVKYLKLNFRPLGVMVSVKKSHEGLVRFVLVLNARKL